MDYIEFARELRKVILPDAPMQSEAEWKLHRITLDRIDMFFLTALRLRLMFVTRGMPDSDVQKIYTDILDFFKGIYTEEGRVPVSRHATENDVELHWRHENQFYIYQPDMMNLCHCIRLDNGCTVNFKTAPAVECLATSNGERKKERKKKVVLFNHDFAPPEESLPEGTLPCGCAEEWDDDLYIYFQRVTLDDGKAQGKHSDEIEKYVRSILTGSWSKYGQLMQKVNGGKTLFRQELNRFIAPPVKKGGGKFIHKDLRAMLAEELDAHLSKILLKTVFANGMEGIKP